MNEMQANDLEAVCYDQHSLVSGRLDQVFKTGCDLVSAGGQGPCFARKARIILNIFNARTGQSISVGVRVGTIYRRDGQWAYRLRWDEVPCMVEVE